MEKKKKKKRSWLRSAWHNFQLLWTLLIIVIFIFDLWLQTLCTFSLNGKDNPSFLKVGLGGTLYPAQKPPPTLIWAEHKKQDENMESICLNMLSFTSFFSKCHRWRAAVQVRVWCKLFSMHVPRWANCSTRKPRFSLFTVLTSTVSSGLRCWKADIQFSKIKHVCTTPVHHAGGLHLCAREKNEFQEPGQYYLLEALQYQCKLP